MNKKFFTLMAALLVGGAAMPSEAFAQTLSDVNLSTSTNKIALDGAKFYMKSGITSKFWTVKDSVDTNYAVLDRDTATLTVNKAVFEVKNFNKSTKTFELWVNGKQLAEKVGNVAHTTFYAADNAGSMIDKTDFSAIRAAVLGSTGADIFRGSAAEAHSESAAHDAASLNAFLKPGVKFSFPDAQNLEENPLAEKMYAIPGTAFGGTIGNIVSGTDSVVFVKADAAATKWYNNGTYSVSADAIKDLNILVANENSKWGITGLTSPAGLKLEFVKGSALKADNDKDKGEVKASNALFKFTEADLLNATGAVDIEIAINGATYKVGAYSLTAGGLKSFVTTVNATDPISKAQIGGGTFADTKALIKADGKSVYNLFFTGELSADKGTTTGSWFGKYLINNTKTGNTEPVAPGNAVLDVADAQWVVTSVGSKGSVTLTNARTFADNLSLTLYATDEAGLYELSTGAGPGNEATHVKFIPVTEDNTYTTFEDGELEKAIEFVFKGSGAISVSDIYVTYDRSRKQFVGTQTANSSFKGFKLAKGTQIMKGYSYAYLNGENIASKTDSLAVQAYTITAQMGDSIKNIAFRADHVLDSIPYGAPEIPMQLVFKKNADGHVHALSFSEAVKDHTEEVTEYLFNNSIAANTANLLYINATSGEVDTINVAGSASYCNVAYEFVGEKGISLPAEEQYAIFEGKDGAIAWKESATGALEGVLAETPLTFRLDTADTDKKVPSFYISKAVATEEETEVRATEPDREMLFNPTMYLKYWDENSASWKDRAGMKLSDGNTKAVFITAAVTGIDEAIRYDEEGEVVAATADDVKALKFTITEADAEGNYYIQSVLDDKYLYSLNGKLGYTDNIDYALAVAVGEGDATANEAIAAEAGVQVIGGQGVVTVQGAAGKVVTVANILGQTIANQVAASDNVTIAAPAGIVVVSVDGEATKVVVK